MWAAYIVITENELLVRVQWAGFAFGEEGEVWWELGFGFLFPVTFDALGYAGGYGDGHHRQETNH